ncbi:unnamed protein product, partial [Adineta steineri]
LNIMEGKLEANEINLTLIGEIGYTTTQTISSGKGRTSTQTKYHHIPFYSAKAIFVRPDLGQKELVYNQGNYSWPFQILLTEHLPPTLNQPQSYPHVRYYLQVMIEKTWYKPNKRETRYLTIFPRVNLLHNPQCLISTIFGNENRKDIKLKGTLNKLGFVPGELIVATLEIENRRNVLIQCINLSMTQLYDIGRNSRKIIIFDTVLPNIINLRNEFIRETFSILIPNIRLPPSYQFQGGLQASANVHIHYTIRFAIKVEGIFTNFDIDIPIILGTESNSVLNHDSPPSYNFVVSHAK